MTSPLASLNQDPVNITKIEGTNVAPGGELTLANLTGPGYVSGLWMAVGGGNNPALDGRIRVFYDGSSTPAIDTDLGTLLATHWGASGDLHMEHLHAEQSPQYNDQTAFLMTYPMPFGTSIKISYLYPNLSTQTAGVFSMVYWSPTSTDRAAGQRLRGSARNWASQAVTRTAGDTNTLLSTSGGPGSIVHVSYVAGGAPATNYTWLERDFALYRDGETTPSFATTGTEDTFDSGWYFNGWSNTQISTHSYLGTNSPSNNKYVLGMVTDYWSKLGGLPYTTSAVLKVLNDQACTTPDTFTYCVLYYQ